jgi:hypothetical protein
LRVPKPCDWRMRSKDNLLMAGMLQKLKGVFYIFFCVFQCAFNALSLRFKKRAHQNHRKTVLIALSATQSATHHPTCN